MAINPSATIDMKRTAESVDGVMTFTIVTTIVEAQEIPPEMFVIKINDSSDPNDDTFERIATLSDLDTLYYNRADAVDNGFTEYRAGSFTKEYTDIEVAAAAVTSIKARINTLVESWKTYVNDYLDGPDQFTTPIADPSILSALIAVYEAAKASREAADTTLADANTTLEDAETEHTNCMGDYVGLEYLMNLVPDYEIAADSVQLAVNVLNAAVLGLTVGYNNTTGGNQSTIKGYLDTVTNAYNTINANNGTVQSNMTNKQNEVNSKRITCNEYLASVVAAQKDVAVAQAEQESAQTKENEALTDVQDACPGWMPS